MVDLKRCPFCGEGGEHLAYRDAWTGFALKGWIECTHCHAAGSDAYAYSLDRPQVKEYAAHLWNERYDEAEPDQ